jgi:hypothetical protein
VKHQAPGMAGGASSPRRQHRPRRHRASQSPRKRGESGSPPSRRGRSAAGTPRFARAAALSASLLCVALRALSAPLPPPCGLPRLAPRSLGPPPRFAGSGPLGSGPAGPPPRPVTPRWCAPLGPGGRGAPRWPGSSGARPAPHRRPPGRAAWLRPGAPGQCRGACSGPRGKARPALKVRQSPRQPDAGCHVAC